MSPEGLDRSIVPPNVEDSIPSAFVPTQELSTLTSLSEVRSPMLLVYRRRKLSLPDSSTVSSSGESIAETRINENTCHLTPLCPNGLSVALVYKRRKLSQPDSAAAISSAGSLAGTGERGNTSLSAGICPNAIAVPHVYKRRREHSQRAGSAAASLAGTIKVENPDLFADRSPNALSLAFVYKRRKLLKPASAAVSSEDSLAATRQRRHSSLSIGLVYKRRRIVYKRRRKLSQRDKTSFSLAEYLRRTRSSGNASFAGLYTNASHSEGTARSVNESCSSSRSNVDFILGSTNKEVDDTGECSSSAVPPSETLGKGASERDICISILVRHGVIKRVRPCSSHSPGVRIGGHGCRLCSVCSRSGSTGRMLICDDCEEAFHLSCCSPQIKAIPVDEWLCHWCLRKNRKVVRETSKCHNISDGAVGSLKAASARGARLVELMLIDTKPYVTNVRVGKGFQAEVPEWSGPAVL
ncbi:PHD and RING finger domain-containing protein 1 [Linum perenne]